MNATATNRKPKCALYARVSTRSQECENQLRDLRTYAQNRGWEIEGEYIDAGISGAVEQRPGLEKLWMKAKQRAFSHVLVWRFDRWARSLKQLILSLEELQSLGISFVSYTEALDLSTPTGKLTFSLVGAMAAMERDLLVSRVVAGQRRAQAQGVHIGRSKIGVSTDTIKKLRHQGFSLREIGRRLGVSRMTIRDRLQSSRL